MTISLPASANIVAADIAASGMNIGMSSYRVRK